MSPLESRAWLALWGLGPAYVAYFALLIACPNWFTTMTERFIWLGAVSCVNAGIFVVGLVRLKAKERGEHLLSDERDRAIQANANRIAYLALLAGVIVVGMMLPFTQGGWKIVNAALLAIVLAEALRNGLIVQGYRAGPRLAH